MTKCYKGCGEMGACHPNQTDEVEALKACLLTNVEGQECDCGESGMTASGVGVCMEGDECRLSWADRLLVEDFATAVSIEEKP